MEDEQNKGLTSQERRNLVIFSALVSQLPGNLLGRPLPGVLGAMEAVRIVTSAQRQGGAVQLLDAGTAHPLAAIAAQGELLRLNNDPLPLRWLLCHRASLKPFDHLLLATGEKAFRVICGAGSPLADDTGRRLFAKHFARHGHDIQALDELYHELNAVVALLQQGNPLERLGPA